MLSKSRSLVLACGLTVALLSSPHAMGHGVTPQNTPVDRLIANIEAHLKDEPDNPIWHYRLGRVYMLALERESTFALAYEHDMRPAEGSWAERNWENPNAAPKQKASREVLETYLNGAIEHLNRAIELRPMEARYRLTLACTLEAGAKYRNTSTPWPLPVKPTKDFVFEDEAAHNRYVGTILGKNDSLNELLDDLRRGNVTNWNYRDRIMSAAWALKDNASALPAIGQILSVDWTTQMEDQYFAAMCLALPADGKADEKPFWGGMNDWVAYEAANDFARVVTARTARPEDQIRLKVAKATVKAFDELPVPNAITPLVINLEGQPLSKLLLDSTTNFDLDASGLVKAWSWVSPQTGILVWDPNGTGVVKSGMQLFGSISWNVLFHTGYEALACLDDNQDKQISGDELRGIAAWFDRDSDGVSDAGEVVSLQSLGVTSLSTVQTGIADDGISPMSARGLRLRDGRTLPTYDWIAETKQAAR